MTKSDWERRARVSPLLARKGLRTLALEINLTLSLPRDAATVPLVRELCRTALHRLGVLDDCISDVQLAISEACANVVRHSNQQDDYEVRCSVAPPECVLTVVDNGHGFDGSSVGHGQAAADAETGRGIQLMRSLMDRVAFDSRPEAGTVVHLVKQLAIDPQRRPSYVDA